MRVFLVEDDGELVETIVASSDQSIDFTIAADRDSAMAQLDAPLFDVIVCDLKIPASPGATPEIEHGIAVLTRLRSSAPGTPIIAFTANRTTEVMDLLLREQRKEDFLGTADQRSMLAAIDKDELPEFLTNLDELRAEFALLEQVQVVMSLGHAALPMPLERVLRIYSRQRDCSIVRVRPLTEGQSGVPVMRLDIERPDGSAGGSAVARLTKVQTVEAERRKYQQRVSGVLPLGTYAEIVGQVTAGAGRTGGVFYQLADDYEPLFKILAQDDQRAAAAVARLPQVQEPWRDGAPAADVEVREIRRLLIDDDRWSQSVERCGLDSEVIETIEALVIPIRRTTVHADLHGDNILVAEEPVIIDFVSVTDGASPIDPVSLELSLLFHPHAPEWAGTWPTPDQLLNWHDFAAYADGAPFPAFLEACRTWALEVARGNLDLHACAYAYVASQARFDSSDGDRLSALMAGLRAQLHA